MLTIFSPTIRHIPYLSAFIADSISARLEKSTTAIIGWGHKPTADKARRIAQKKNIPYIALEDGFYRSLGLGCMGANPLSLVVDKVGIYYDATCPSELENMLNNDELFTVEQTNSAERAIHTIITHDLSKYNHASPAPYDYIAHFKKKKAYSQEARTILLIDQTQGDSSVHLGLANEQSFYTMLDSAIQKYPKDLILVKTHPDVLAGKKKGYLTAQAQEKNISVIAEDFSPLSLLKQVDIVYTVSSQMGFEALLLKKEVYTFGMPFYAGWGLTTDALTCQRRTKKRTLEELFVASCLLYPRYINPITEEPTDIHQTLQLLALQRMYNEANKGFYACLGFSRWKRPHAQAYGQSTNSTFKFYSNAQKALLDAQKHKGKILVWASRTHKKYTKLTSLCEQSDIPLLLMEDGFIRSVGLGSNFHWPYSLVLDKKGMYYDPTKESDLEEILNSIKSHNSYSDICQQALNVQKTILEKGLTKYNVGNNSSDILSFLPRKSLQQKIVLVPGQVEDDASVLKGGMGISSNLELLQTVRKNTPSSYIIYKPHPDVEIKNRKGLISDDRAMQYADIIIKNEKMHTLLKYVDEVHTLTSLTGFEALLRGLKVFCYGMPFYAGWGLTTDVHTCERRKAKLSLAELIAGTLLLYPRYYDWKTKQFVTAQDVCFRLLQPQEQQRGQYKSRLWTRFFNYFKSILKS